jgi:LPXTG-motif cell wall-anchored protein
VTVRYEDEKGNELSEAIVMSGNVGDSYSSEQKEFPDYTLKEVKGAASGTFGINPQQVVYVYQKEASSTDQSTTSNDKKPTDSTTPSEKGAASNDHKPKESGDVPPTHSPKDPSTNKSEQDYTEEGRKNRKLPQTNEQANLFLATIGFSLLVLIFISSILYKKYRVLKNK